MLNHIAPTKRYFVTMFAVSCLLLTIFSAAVYRQSHLNNQRNQWVIHSYEVLRHAQITMTQLLNFEAGQRGYLLSGSSKFFDPYDSASHEIEKEMALLAIATEDNAPQRTNVATLRVHVENYKNTINRHLKKFIHTQKHALSVVELEESQHALDLVRADLDQLIATEYKFLDARLEAARKQQRSYVLTLLLGTTLGLGSLAVANMIIYSLMSRSKRIEHALTESEERFKQVMNALNDGIYDYEPQKNTIYFSPSYKSMLGYTDAEFPSNIESFSSFIHPDDAERTWKVFHDYAESKGAIAGGYHNIFRMRHHDGTWRWHMSRGLGTWDTDGNMIRLIGAHTDITDQKEREEELKQLNADLESFAYIASHDLRAPLVNLKGFAGEITHSLQEIRVIIDRITETLPPDEKALFLATFNKDVPEALGFINSSVERMDKLTSAILHMSRVGRQEYKLEPVDSQAIVQRCLNALAHDIAKRQVTVESSELPVIVTDALALEQIFGNLLDNAIKYLDPNKPGQIFVHAKVFLTEILFSVSDNGRGISDADAHKVFEIFRRAANSTNIRGTGMGMAYVKTLMRKLGGRIWFESELGKGTIFYFTLPVRVKGVAL